MSSVLRTTKAMSNLPLISWVNGPCMITSLNEYEPPRGFGIVNGEWSGPPINFLFQNLIPFLYDKNVLEIDFEAVIPCYPYGYCSFQETMMTTQANASIPHFPTYFNFPLSAQVRMMGGTNLITDIGANFRQYIMTIYASQFSDTVTSIKVYSEGIVTKVQVLDIINLGTWLSIINPTVGGGEVLSGDSITPPVGDYVSQIIPGSNYGITYVFLKPLTLAVTMANNGVHYFTLKSQISSGKQ